MLRYVCVMWKLDKLQRAPNIICQNRIEQKACAKKNEACYVRSPPRNALLFKHIHIYETPNYIYETYTQDGITYVIYDIIYFKQVKICMYMMVWYIISMCKNSHMNMRAD